MEVYITGRTKQYGTYHSERDCRQISHCENIRVVTKKQVSNYELCSVCDNGVDQSGGPQGHLTSLKEAALREETETVEIDGREVDTGTDQ